MPEDEVATEAVEEAHVEEKAPTEVVEEAPAPVEEAPKVPNIFVHEEQPYTGTLTGPRLLVVVDEGKGYPMDESANNWVREHNIPILSEMPEGVKAEGASEYADLTNLTRKLEASS